MTSLDPSHLPSKHHPSRGGAVVYERGRKNTLPVPDLRFEQSYLRSIKRYTYFNDSNATAVFVDEKNAEAAGRVDTAVALEGSYGLPLQINWGGVLYLSVRDQIISPFLQGAALAMATLYLLPFVRGLGARIRTQIVGTYQAIFTPLSPQIRGSIHWTGRQLKDIAVSGASTNLALAK